MEQTTGQLIRSARKRLGLSQLELGRILYEGLSKNAQQLRISRLEKSTTLKPKTLGRVAKALGVSVAELLPRKGGAAGEEPPEEGGAIIRLSADLIAAVPKLGERLAHLSLLSRLAPDVGATLVGLLRQWADELENELRQDQPYHPVPRYTRRNGSDGLPSD
jgi:transcriptional regulator with XRE-family HTH domain